jgi:flagellar protein FlaF
MNTAVFAQSLYARPTRELGTARGIEYKAFSKVTARLSSWNKDTDSFASLAEALYDNQILWNVLGADVADQGNELPPRLRAQLFYLTEFTNVQTRKIMAGEAEPAILVEINTSIMRGLRDCAGALNEVAL